MNGAAPDPEPTTALEPVWERPWSVEEIRRSSQSWSLAADAGLLQFLQEFSQNTISRTHEIKKQVDGLIRETKATDCRLHNVFNDFLMLSNTQFIENRVYDEEMEEPVLKTEPERTEQERTREQKEVDLIPKVQEAVNYGLQVLDSAFEQLDIKAGNSDSEEEDANERVELILEPKDLYIDRPLPYLIGSKLFMEQEDVGLGELSSEEGSVGSDRGSFVDSEEEKEQSDEDFAHPSDNDQNQHTAHMSEEEEDDDGCDLFADYEKEEEDIEDVEQSIRPEKRPTSFADELAARIKGDLGQMDESPTRDTKPWKTQKEKERKAVSDDEEDNLFVPPKVTSEDFLPFGSRGGLFSGGKGLFDEDEDESDLFKEAPKDWEVSTSVHEEPSSSKPGKKIPAGAVSVFLGDAVVFGAASPPSLKESPRPEQPTPGKSSQLPVPSGLFDNDDADDDFFVASCSKPSQTDKVKCTADIFDDEDGDLFKEKPATLPEAALNLTDGSKARAEKKAILASSRHLKLMSETKAVKSLFSDEEDSEDLFSSQNASKSKGTFLPSSKLPASVSLFDDEDEEDNLFGTIAAKKQTSSLLTPSQEKTKFLETSMKKTSTFLFSSDEEDQWSITDSQTNSASDKMPKGELRDFGTTQDKEAKKVVKKTSVFEEDDEGDLFAAARDSQKKTERISLLFEDDADIGDFLHASPSTSVPSAVKDPDCDAGPQSTGVFQDEELLFSNKLQKDNDPDVELFTGSKNTEMLEPSVGSLFEDDEDDDLFSAAKSQTLIPEKKRVLKEDHPVSSSKTQKHPESSKEKNTWKLERPQASLAINPAALLPVAASQISGAKPLFPRQDCPPSEPRNGEAGVSFDLPPQTDTLHSASKSRVKVRGRRRPQTRAARRLAAQESSEAEDMSITRGPILQLGDSTISPDFHQPQPRAARGEDSCVAAAAQTLEGSPLPEVDRNSFAESLRQPLEGDLFDSGDIFSKSSGSQSMGKIKAKEKAAEAPASQLGASRGQGSIFCAHYEAGSDDLFQSVKRKPAKKASPFSLLEDEDDFFTDHKGKKNELKSNNQQDSIFETQDIFEDDIFATEAITPSQKTKEKERALESNLFDDNIDIFADLTVKPKEKSKKKVETKSIFDDDMDDIFSGTQAKTSKPRNQSAQALPEPRSEHKVSSIFEDPLNAFGGQ